MNARTEGLATRAIRAAIYCRKSNEQNVADDAKSVERQREHARAYAEERGWHVDDEHVYVDDGVSGAEFKRRPALLRLLNALKHRPFDVVVCSELSRIGRDQIQTAQVLAQIEAAGVAVELYMTKERLRFETAVDRFLTSAVSFAAELEREKAGQRVRDALVKKANAGYAATGSCYGYRNVKILGPDGKKSHSEYRIDAEQAEVVRGIYRAYASGLGRIAICKALNGDPAYERERGLHFGGKAHLGPFRKKSKKRSTGVWGPSTIRVMLTNARYRGTLEFGRRRNITRDGTKAVVLAKEGIVRVERPDLAVVPLDLWNAVQERLAATRRAVVTDNFGARWKRSGPGCESRFLLSGLGVCGSCGRSVVVTGGAHRAYGCSFHHTKGVCGNALRAPQAATDAVVLDEMRRLVTPDIIASAVERAVARQAELLRRNPGRAEQLEAELRQAQRERDNILALIKLGAAPRSIVAEIATLDDRIETMERELTDLSADGELDLRTLRNEFRSRAEEFGDLLRGDVPRVRQSIRRLVPGGIVFDPVEVGGLRRYRLGWAISPLPMIEATYMPGKSTY